MALTFLTRAIFLARLVAIILAQPPAQGIQLGNPESNFQFPLAVSQCEPILIWYNRTTLTRNIVIYFFPPEAADSELSLQFFQIIAPFGSGYIEWICNIPAGYAFVASYLYAHYIVVQPGTSSSCLRNITTKYEYVVYATSNFQSYTAHPPNTTRPIIRSDHLANSTVPFITGDLTTITVNPDLVIASTTTQSTSTRTPSSVVTSRTRSSMATASLSSVTSSHKPNVPATAGGIVGSVIIVAIALSVFIFMRRRRTSQEVANRPAAASEPFRLVWMASQTADETARQRTNVANGALEPFGCMPSQPMPATKTGDSPTRGNMDLAHAEGGGPRLPRTTKRNPIVLPHALPISPPPAPGSPNPQSNLAAALDTVSHIQPTAPEQEVLISSLPLSPDANPSMPIRQTDTSRAEIQTEMRSSYLIAALNIISQMTAAERNTLALVLNSTTTPGYSTS